MTRVRFGVLGKSLVHSDSPALFAERFKKEGILEASYERFERENLNEFKEWLDEQGSAEIPLKGLNVTIPYKQQIIPYLSELTAEAKAVGAVNAIKPTSGGWIGHNTDVEGFLKPLRPFLKSSHERALILGDGGAAAAVRFGLQSLGIDVLHVTRKPIEWHAVRYAELTPEGIQHYKLIVQCTPVGTYPNIDDCLPIPWEGIGAEHLIVDLIYNPPLSAFLKKALKAGATQLNGKEMLKAQAEAAWKWWNT